MLSQETCYDAAGQVTKAIEPQKEERFVWDPAVNRTEEHRNPVWHNLLLRPDGLKLDYDGFGRLVQRRDRSGVIQHFAYDDDPLVWVDPWGLAPCIYFNKTHKDLLPKPKGMGPNGGRLQSHHGLQQEWAINNLSQYGYNPKFAPTVTIETGKGLPHIIISNAQNARRDLRVAQGKGKWSSSLQDELNNIVTHFRDAGFKDEVIQIVLDQQYRMLDKLNVPYAKVELL